MSIADWGKATWYLFHTLAEKIKPTEEAHVPQLLKQILYICKHIPCPICKEHANKTLQQVKLNKITTRENLIKFLWDFHNIVNRRKEYECISLEKCKGLYSRAVTDNMVNYFTNIFGLNAKNERAMLDTYHRGQCILRFKKYITKNRHRFNN